MGLKVDITVTKAYNEECIFTLVSVRKNRCLLAFCAEFANFTLVLLRMSNFDLTILTKTQLRGQSSSVRTAAKGVQTHLSAGGGSDTPIRNYLSRKEE